MKIKLTLNGSITVFILLMVGFIIGLYLFKFTSPVLAGFTGNINDPELSATGFLNEIAEAILSAFTNLTVVLPMVGFGLLTGFIGGNYAGGSILRFIIPVMLIFAVMNTFIFPVIPTVTKGVQHEVGFAPLILILSVILNVLLFLTIFEFVSGRD